VMCHDEHALQCRAGIDLPCRIECSPETLLWCSLAHRAALSIQAVQCSSSNTTHDWHYGSPQDRPLQSAMHAVPMVQWLSPESIRPQHTMQPMQCRTVHSAIQGQCCHPATLPSGNAQKHSMGTGTQHGNVQHTLQQYRSAVQVSSAAQEVRAYVVISRIEQQQLRVLAPLIIHHALHACHPAPRDPCMVQDTSTSQLPNAAQYSLGAWYRDIHAC
jgi:hypothetical protein